jgi:hypothetical protein
MCGKYSQIQDNPSLKGTGGVAIVFKETQRELMGKKETLSWLGPVKGQLRAD